MNTTGKIQCDKGQEKVSVKGGGNPTSLMCGNKKNTKLEE